MEAKTAHRGAGGKPAEISMPPVKKKRFLKGSIAWIATLFIVSGSMFFLGLLVGRGLSPVRFDKDEVERDLTRLKNTFAIPSLKKNQDVHPVPLELEFFDALKKPGEEVDHDTKLVVKAPLLPPDMIPPDPPPETEENTPFGSDKKDPMTETSAPPVKEVKPVVKVEQKPSDADTESSPKVEKPDKEKKPGLFTIQVASYKQATEADRLVKQLLSKGFPAYRSIGAIAGKGVWYRVRLGSYETRGDAGPMLEALGREKLKGFVLPKER